MEAKVKTILPNTNIDVSIVVVSFNTKDITLDCLHSVLKNTAGIKYEIIVIDNASTDGSIESIKKLTSKNPTIYLIENKHNVGFAAANNQGTQRAKGKYVLFLNSDTVIETNVVGELKTWMDQNKEVGASGVKIIGKDSRLQEAGGYFPTLPRVFSWMTIQDLPFIDSLIKPFHPLKKKSLTKNDSFFDKRQELDWIIGAFIFVRSEIVTEIDGWSEDYFMYTEDVDLCFKIRSKGYKIVYLPDWQITHLGGASSKSREFPLLSEYKSIKLFYKKHYPRWQYPILQLLLKIGALGRILLFGILEGKESAKIYAKAFKEA